MEATKKEEQQGRIMPREDFKLLKFKVSKDGVTVTHHVNGVCPADITAIVDVKPHPDLQEKMDQLKVYMATRLGLLEGWDFARESLKKNPNYLQNAIAGHGVAKERCNVGGLTFLGTGETYGVSITGSIKTPTNGSVGLAVPKISFDKDDLGYEDEVKEICDEITNEVYNYLILRKKEQTNIEDQAEGFDNNGGVDQKTLDMFDDTKKPSDWVPGSESHDGDFDENGEREFVPDAGQLTGKSEEEE